MTCWSNRKSRTRRECPGYQVQTMQELISQLTPNRFPGLQPALYTVIGIACIIGFLVIFQSMYLAVMERTREIGILKALGASKAYIVSAILRETGMLAVGGIIAGYHPQLCGPDRGYIQLPHHRIPDHGPLGALGNHPVPGGRTHRRNLSGVQGGSQRPHRCAGV